MAVDPAPELPLPLFITALWALKNVNVNIPPAMELISVIRFPSLRLRRRTLAAGVAIAVTLTGVTIAASTSAQAAGQGPCDIYAAAGTPCVAAHSTTRALFGAYNGALYQVRRASDNATTNIGLLSTGGYANAGAQDSFCNNTTCVITIIYDQTSRHND